MLFNLRSSYRWLSQPTAGTPGIECLEVPSFVRDYHAYKDIWEPENGEMLELKWERENCKDIKCGRSCERWPTVGNIPKNLAPHFSFFLARDFNKGLCEVAGVRVNCGGGYGLEIPCVFKLYGPRQFVEYGVRIMEVPLYCCISDWSALLIHMWKDLAVLPCLPVIVPAI